MKVRPVTPTLNLLTTTKKLSKSMICFLLIARILVSLNFGVGKFKSTKVNLVATLFSVLQAVFVSTVLMSHIVHLEQIAFAAWYSSYILEYLVIVIVLGFSKNDTFADIYIDINSIDGELGEDNIPDKAECIMITMILSVLLYRCFLSFLYCSLFLDFCFLSTTEMLLFLFPLLCTDVFLIVLTCLFYCCSCRLRKLVKLVANGNGDVVKCHYLYKSIADIAEKIKPLYGCLYVLPLALHSLDVMITVFYPLILMDKELRPDTSVTLITANLSVVQVLILLFSPAFTAGQLAAIPEELKVILHNKLLQDRDQVQAADIERFIRYIDTRPLKFIIFRIVPLDWNLPIIVVNICVTYLIVMLQFSIFK